MAIGDLYATLEELKARLQPDGDFGTDEDDALTRALGVASRSIEAFCGRQFNKDAAAAVRQYSAESEGPRILSPTRALVDDFHTTNGLVIATGDDGTFGTVWTSADYELHPLNRMRHGELRPYWKVKAVGSLTFPTAERATLQVNAEWGWTAVPERVHEACLIIAEDTYKLKDVPFGVAGFGDWGPIRVRQNPSAAEKLIEYRRGGSTLLVA